MHTRKPLANPTVVLRKALTGSARAGNRKTGEAAGFTLVGVSHPGNVLWPGGSECRGGQGENQESGTDKEPLQE